MSENDAVVEETVEESQQVEADAPVENAPADSSSLPDDVERLKSEIARLRKENGAARTNAKAKAAEDARAELTQEFGKLLGFVDNETPADPAELARQIEAEKAARRSTQVELAVYK